MAFDSSEPQLYEHTLRFITSVSGVLSKWHRSHQCFCNHWIEVVNSEDNFYMSSLQSPQSVCAAVGLLSLRLGLELGICLGLSVTFGSRGLLKSSPTFGPRATVVNTIK